MGRKKASNQDELLSKLVGVRLAPDVYTRLEDLQKMSDCQTVAELARRILSKEKIVTYHVDRSFDQTAEELCRIRREINAIGTNINQITHSFHAEDAPGHRVAQALKIRDQYNKVGDKVDDLLKMISEVTKKWLQK